MNTLRIVPLVAGAAGLLYASNTQAALVTYHVDTTADTFDPNGCVDREAGNCSLRSAVYEANKDAMWDAISLPAGNYVIDNAVEGVIDVTTGVHFLGEGADLTTIEFHLPNVITFLASGADAHMLFASVTLQGAAADAGAVYGDDIDYVYLYDAVVRDFDYESTVVGVDEGLLMLQEFELADNTSDDYGARAIYGNHTPGAGVSLWAEDLYIHGNEAPGGGSIVELNYEESWLRRAEIADNTAGDAIFYVYGGYDFHDLYFHHNTAHAGMRFGQGGAPCYLGRSTFAYNSSAFGTIKAEGGAGVCLNNSTFAYNDAMRGSVISTLAGSQVVATQLTVIDNTAIVGAFHAEPGGEVFLEVVAAEGDVGNNLCAGGGSFTAWGSNAFSGDATCPMHPTDVMVPDLMLEPFADNGGFAPTMKPLPGSPLIDGAWQFWATWDQRNLPRGNGPTYEIGAFECQPGEC